MLKGRAGPSQALQAKQCSSNKMTAVLTKPFSVKKNTKKKHGVGDWPSVRVERGVETIGEGGYVPLIPH